MKKELTVQKLASKISATVQQKFESQDLNELPKLLNALEVLQTARAEDKQRQDLRRRQTPIYKIEDEFTKVLMEAKRPVTTREITREMVFTPNKVDMMCYRSSNSPRWRSRFHQQLRQYRKWGFVKYKDGKYKLTKRGKVTMQHLNPTK